MHYRFCMKTILLTLSTVIYYPISQSSGRSTIYTTMQVQPQLMFKCQNGEKCDLNDFGMIVGSRQNETRQHFPYIEQHPIQRLRVIIAPIGQQWELQQVLTKARTNNHATVTKAHWGRSHFRSHSFIYMWGGAVNRFFNGFSSSVFVSRPITMTVGIAPVAICLCWGHILLYQMIFLHSH